MLHKLAYAITISAALFFTPLFAADTASGPDQAEKRAAIKEMLDAMHLEQMLPALQQQIVSQMGSTMLETAKNVIAGNPKLSAAKKTRALRELEAGFPEMLGEMQQVFAKIDIARISVDVYTKTYEKYLSVAEIQDITAFYKSPTGQKLLQNMPQIVGEAMPELMKQIAPTLNEGLSNIAGKHASMVLSK